MRITRRSLLAAAAGATLVGGASGCVGEKQKDVVTVGLTYIPNIQFSPFYLAKAENLFEGLSVELRHHGVQEDAFGALLTGTEDVVFAAADEALAAAAGGSSLATFATSYQRYPVAILAPEGTRNVSELRGKQVGLPGHYGSNYYGVLAALKAAGMSESDVELVDIGYTQVSALTANRVSAVVGFVNNEAVQLEAEGYQAEVMAVQEASAPQLVGPGLIAQPGHLQATQLRSLAAGMLEAERRIAKEPQLAIEAALEHVPTLAEETQRKAAEAVLAATIELWQRDGELTTAVDEEAFAAMGDFLVGAGIIEKAPAEPVIKL